MQKEAIFLDDILSIIAKKKSTGVLTLETDVHLGTLTFKDGLLIGTQSPYGQKLGDIILLQNKIDAELLLKAVENQKKHGSIEPLGSMFVKMGKITLDEVKEIVIFQMEDALNTFRKWINVSFSFSPTDITAWDNISIKPKKYLQKKS